MEQKRNLKNKNEWKYRKKTLGSSSKYTNGGGSRTSSYNINSTDDVTDNFQSPEVTLISSVEGATKRRRVDSRVMDQSSSSSSSGARGLQKGLPEYRGKDDCVSKAARGLQNCQTGIDETWQQHQSRICSPTQAVLGVPFTQPWTEGQSPSCSTAAFTQASVDDGRSLSSNATPVETSDNLQQDYQQRLDDLLQFYNGHASTPEVTPSDQFYATGPNQKLHPYVSRS